MTLTVTRSGNGMGVLFKFSGKPSERIRDALKRNGYRWSPMSGVWHSRKVVGSADLECAIRKIMDSEGAAPAANCHDDPGYIEGGNYQGPDRFDMAYEDDCARRCGL